MSTYCDECEIALACVGSVMVPYLHRCLVCGRCFAQVNGKTIMREATKCRLPVLSTGSWCNVCGRNVNPELYDEEGNVKKDYQQEVPKT